MREAGEPRVVTQPPLRVAAVPHRGPYWEIGQAFGRLDAIVAATGLRKAAVGLIGVYHDDPAVVPAEALRSDAGVIVDAAQSIPRDLAEVSLAGGKFVTVSHRGPYAQLPDAWSALRTFLGQRGYVRRPGPSYEIYLNTPAQVAAGDLETEIYIPIA